MLQTSSSLSLQTIHKLCTRVELTVIFRLILQKPLNSYYMGSCASTSKRCSLLEVKHYENQPCDKAQMFVSVRSSKLYSSSSSSEDGDVLGDMRGDEGLRNDVVFSIRMLSTIVEESERSMRSEKEARQHSVELDDPFVAGSFVMLPEEFVGPLDMSEDESVL